MYKTEKLYGKMDMPSFIDQYVDVEEFIGYCRACDSYEKIWSCPEYDFDAMGYWENYGHIHIIGSKIIFDEETVAKERTPEELANYMDQVLGFEKQALAEILYEAESRYPGSVSLSAGSCHLCDACEKVYGRPCQYPDKMRYSMESLGANVGKTCSKLLRVELLWAEERKLPGYFVLISALLANEETVTFQLKAPASGKPLDQDTGKW